MIIDSGTVLHSPRPFTTTCLERAEDVRIKMTLKECSGETR